MSRLRSALLLDYVPYQSRQTWAAEAFTLAFCLVIGGALALAYLLTIGGAS